MVRLKGAVTTLTYQIRARFQFLMVRLKAGDFNCPNVQEVFQFLMVRLKGCRFQARVFLAETISIPYGAIKSNGVFNCPNLTSVFQFLMVRLKGRP